MSRVEDVERAKRNLALDLAEWTAERCYGLEGAYFKAVTVPDEYIAEKMAEIERLNAALDECQVQRFDFASKNALQIDKLEKENFGLRSNIVDLNIEITKLRDERDTASAEVVELKLVIKKNVFCHDTDAHQYGLVCECKKLKNKEHQ